MKGLCIMKLETITNASKVIPVVVINDIKQTHSMMAALLEGGIPSAEITLRTPCALDAIKYASANFPDMFVGAGTVINADQAEAAIKAGACFIVSPGLSEGVAEVCRKYDVPYIPGCVTPTEIMKALELGITTVKFFPANVYGGLSAIKALAAPFTQVKFMPTGGVSYDNINEFLSFDKIAAVGGSFMMKGDIVQNCKKLLEIIG